MAIWLVKTEPSTYSFGDLQKEKEATWDGVSNALALKHIRAMKKGDVVVVYHSGSKKAAVGVAQVTSDPYPDPKDAKLTVFDLKPLKALARPVTLAEFKAEPAFAGWELLRLGRLSVMPVPEGLWQKIQRMASGPPIK